MSFSLLISYQSAASRSGGTFRTLAPTWAYLLVCIGDTKEEIQYGVSLVWVSPHQARTPTMEEVVEKLATCTSNGSDWPYILAQLYEGFGSCTTPQGQTPGHPVPWRGGGDLQGADQ